MSVEKGECHVCVSTSIREYITFTCSRVTHLAPFSLPQVITKIYGVFMTLCLADVSEATMTSRPATPAPALIGFNPRARRIRLDFCFMSRLPRLSAPIAQQSPALADVWPALPG